MFLKSLELNGFKSFAQKTVLEFPAGITAIVGPNGSGKSNLIDAIRWLLGEREAKNLRGAKAEDLIFAGTAKRPRVSMAQAGLHFDNSKGFFSVDFSEVSVARRVARDGNSQYFLNKSETRLKDIVDFFARSRLGTKGLIIINQGNSDLFVRVSPEERRIMVEEILGLREYQIKKAEAERKLGNTAINLDKVQAMISEIEPHLKRLRRQTAKWEKRSEAEKELKDIEDKYFSFKLREIKKLSANFAPEINKLEKQITEKYKELNGLKEEIQKLEPKNQEKDNIKSIKRQQDELLSRRSEIQREFGRLEAKIELLSVSKSGVPVFNTEETLNLINNIKESLKHGLNYSDFEKLRKTIEDLIVKIEQFLDRGNDAKGADAKLEDIKELEKLKSDLTNNISLINKDLERLTKTEQEITDSLESFNKNFQKTFEIKEAKKEEINDLESRKSKIIFEKEKLNLKLRDLKEQISQIGRSIEEFQYSEVKLPNIEKGEVFDIEKKMFKLRAHLASIGEIDESLIKEAAETETHYNFLTSQSKDLESALTDLKNLIKELSEKIHSEFNSSLKVINEEFNKFFRLMFGGGFAKLKVEREKRKGKSLDEENTKNETEINKEEEREEISTGVCIDLNLPKKRINSLDALSGGEKSLVSIAALFALISVSPPPFLVLDEIDAALDEQNSKRFADLIKDFANKTQFVIVTHNRTTMEVADVLYGVTMEEDGVSKILSLKLETNTKT